MNITAETLYEWGFNKTQAIPEIVKAFNSLQDNIYKSNMTWIVSDEDMKRLKAAHTSKFIGNYNNKQYRKIVSQTEWEEIQQKALKKQQEEEEKQRKKEEEAKQAYKEVEEIKQNWEGAWRDNEWIKQHIGEYYTDSPVYSYYWSLIGGDYRIGKKGQIFISRHKADEISKMKIGDLKGTTFLTRRFKRYGRSSCIEIGDPKGEHYGIYGIYQDDKLVYIGSTLRDFEVRWNEHKENSEKKSQEIYLYRAIENHNLQYKILLDVTQLKVERPLTRNEIEAIELAMIHLNQPIGNLGGTSYKYKFS